MGRELFDFTKPAQGVVTQEQIPPQPATAKCDQSFDMRSGDVYHIFDADRLVFTAYQVEEWVNLGKPGEDLLVRLKSPQNALVMHLSNWQIAKLEKDGRIVPVGAAAADVRGGTTPGYALSIKGKRLEKAEKMLVYIDAVFEAFAKYCEGGHSRKVMEWAVRDLAEKRGETPPSLTSLYDKLARLRKERDFDRTAAVADRPRRGNQKSRKPDRAEQAVTEAIEETLSIGGDWNGVKSLLYGWSEPDGKYSDLPNLVRQVGDVAPMLSDRTIQRRLAQVDHFTRHSLVYGPESAERVFADRIRQLRPEHPLDIVDVDHTTLNIVVFGEGVEFGRPDLIVLRDRFSGIVIGWAVTFGPPSYETFLEALAHAMSPKDADSLPEGVTYRWFGRPFRLGVDNAKHFIGIDIHGAARQLGMQTVKYRPGHPWEKGALEHLFSILGVSLIERLPGSTAMSPEQRMKFDDERAKALPHISIAELNGLLADYFANVHSRKPQQGLGYIPSASAVPETLWEEGLARIPKRPVQDQSVLVRLAGQSREVGISDHGVIRWENLEYQSAAANTLKLSHRHKRGQGKFHGSKFYATRDPSDLSKIWIEIPWEKGRFIEVPISPAYASYATGLKAYQHKRIQEHFRKKTNEAANARALENAKADLMQQMVEIHNKRRKHGTAAKLARFMTKQATRIERSRPVVVEDGVITQRLNLAQPERAKRLKPLSSMAKAQMPAPQAPAVEHVDEDGVFVEEGDALPPITETKTETPRPNSLSIEDIAARNEEWDD
ncbi:hypothetical protein ABWH89_09460 [Hoeflea alexandrii]|uniref:hypothetical protein n=1 Tax=Hoeflea alexandrii TaxID=288436 RepID=UPI0035CF9A48